MRVGREKLVAEAKDSTPAAGEREGGRMRERGIRKRRVSS